MQSKVFVSKRELEEYIVLLYGSLKNLQRALKCSGFPHFDPVSHNISLFVFSIPDSINLGCIYFQLLPSQAKKALSLVSLFRITTFIALVIL
jgi:hypothetical protein